MRPMTIGSLVTEPPTIRPEDNVALLKQILSDRGPVGSTVVLKRQRPVGLVMHRHLNRFLNLQHGHFPLLTKPVSSLMDAAPLIVSTSIKLENAAVLAMQRDEEKIYDNIIVTDADGLYRGAVSVHAILSRMASLGQVREQALEACNQALQQEKSELESQLRRAEKMQAISTMAGGIAHDLNNILSGVVGYAQVLLHHLPEDGPLCKSLQGIKQSGERAAAIVHDLLTMTRRSVKTSASVELRQVIDDYFQSPEFAQLQTNHPAVRICNLGNPLGLKIKGAKYQLAKVIMNLICNAVEATTPVGDVAVCRRFDRLSETCAGYEDIPPGDYAIIDVTDTGSGINADDLPHIFEPFYTKKNMGCSGTGLGLAVVWSVVKDHNGFIDICTGEEKGTTFSLYFPLTDQEERREDQGVTYGDYTGLGESILVVDDVTEQRQIAATMLKKLGYTVATAKSGEEALKLARGEMFDVLLLDMILDLGIDGLETYKQLLRIRPKQKVIIVSEYSETRRIQHALPLGAMAYIKKPYSLEKIGEAVCKVLHPCGSSIDDNAKRTVSPPRPLPCASRFIPPDTKLEGPVRICA